jgi:hypothetical protein
MRTRSPKYVIDRQPARLGKARLLVRGAGCRLGKRRRRPCDALPGV